MRLNSQRVAIVLAITFLIGAAASVVWSASRTAETERELQIEKDIAHDLRQKKELAEAEKKATEAELAEKRESWEKTQAELNQEIETQKAEAEKFKRERDQARASRSAGVRAARSGSAPTAPLSGGDNRALGQEMMLAKWGHDQWNCLDTLWGVKESGWSTTAKNPRSTAYGIPQSLAMNRKQAKDFGQPELAGVPGSKMATHGADWRTNPRTQIAWGLDYIAGRHKTPCGALSHSNREGWY